LAIAALLAAVAPDAVAASVITTRLEDPKAVYLSGAQGDG
jgi:hypothetical protein